MAAPFKLVFQKGSHDRQSQLHARDPCAQAEHIGVVVAAAEAGVQLGGAERGPDAGMAVGRQRHADARAANQNAGAVFSFHGFAEFMGEDGIIATVLGIGAVVDDLIAESGQMLGQGGFQVEAGVIRGQMDALHKLSLQRKMDYCALYWESGNKGTPSGKVRRICSSVKALAGFSLSLTNRMARLPLLWVRVRRRGSGGTASS